MAQNDAPPVFRVEEGQRYDPLTTFEVEDRAHPTARAFTNTSGNFTWVLDCEALVTVIVVAAAASAVLTLFVIWSFTGSIDKEEKNHVALELSSMSISGFGVSRDEIRGHCNISFNIINHGDSQLYFGKALLSVYFEHELLWVAKTDPLYVDVEKSAIFNVSVKEETVTVSDEFVGTAIMGSRSNSSGAAKFLVKFNGVLRDGVGLWLEERDQMYATCGWVHMKFQDATTLTGGPVTCNPRVF